PSYGADPGYGGTGGAPGFRDGSGASAEYGQPSRAGGSGGESWGSSPRSNAGNASAGGSTGSGTPETESRSAGPGAETAAAEAEAEGRPGMSGAPMGGAGNRDKDKEHHTAAYLKNDRNTLDVVGDMDPHVVPVVGEFSDEQN
ncbi:MAG: hypothetical protein J2P17_26755, partial [Mycobacterium sp.]|nr:hypothetical protein [Mycobacterium sp.]